MEAPRVAVVVGLAPDAISVPTVELFRAVSDAAMSAGAWRIYDGADVKANLGAPPPLKALGTLPAFDRRTFVSPEATRGTAAESQDGLVRPVQVMLDTLALDGALIVDCRPEPAGGLDSTAVVTGCGLYFYDRARARTLAAATKSFRTGVADASLWAPELLASLVHGLQTVATNAERERVRTVLAEHEREHEPSALAFEARLDATNLADPLRQVGSLPTAGFVAGTRAGGFFGGLGIATGRSIARSPTGATTVATRSADLYLSAESPALEALIWDLGLGIGYDANVATTTLAGGGRIERRAAVLTIAPGLLWQVNRMFEWGAALRFGRDVPLTETAAGSYVGYAFGTNVVGAGMRLRAIL
jgi:hypothetical protein